MADDTGCNQPWSILPEVHHQAYRAISTSHSLKGAATGKRVLVTGAGRGIGKGIAEAFVQAGARGVAILSRNKAQLDAVKEELLRSAREQCAAATGEDSIPVIVPLVVDVRIPVEVQNAIEVAASAMGGLDIVIANAGAIEKPAKLGNTHPDEWWRIYETNVRGAYNVFHYFLGYLEQAASDRSSDTMQRKVAIAVSDTASNFSPPGLSAHSTSKTALNRLVEYVHLENGTGNPAIRAFAFSPGAVRTDLALQLGEEYHEYLTDNVDLAGGFAVWLACKDSTDFLSGRFLSAQWDVDELLARRDIIERDGLLQTRVLMR